MLSFTYMYWSHTLVSVTLFSTLADNLMNALLNLNGIALLVHKNTLSHKISQVNNFYFYFAV